MYVDYTQSWFDVDKEAAMAEKFIGEGCVIIGQHADSTGAPSACEAAWKDGKVVYSVGYNVDMLDVAPDAALTSASNNWGVYYTYAFKCLQDGKAIDTDWAEGYDADAVKLTPLGANCAAGTQEKVDKVIAGIKDGSIKVFDTSAFTVSAANIEATKNASGAVVTTGADGHGVCGHRCGAAGELVHLQDPAGPEPAGCGREPRHRRRRGHQRDQV